MIPVPFSAPPAAHLALFANLTMAAAALLRCGMTVATALSPDVVTTAGTR